jgi:osmoprotectant transport system substrate-binding protein
MALLLFSGCSRRKPIVVGSKDTTEQQILAEIAAQHLEHQTGNRVRRRFGIGDTGIAYQTLLDGEIGLYPEYADVVITDLLKETPDTDPAVIFERAHTELKRRALLEYLSPLGFISKTEIVVTAAGHEALSTASEAAASNTRWSIAVTKEMQDRKTGLAAFQEYPFQMAAVARTVRSRLLFPAMEENMVNLVLTSSTDGNLGYNKWKTLKDDRMVFTLTPVALLVRDDLLAANSDLRSALDQLSGKISLEAMRKMNSAVEIHDRSVENVATEFLKSSGLD